MGCGHVLLHPRGTEQDRAGTRAAAERGERGPGVGSPPGGRLLGLGPWAAGGSCQQRAADECLREEDFRKSCSCWLVLTSCRMSSIHFGGLCARCKSVWSQYVQGWLGTSPTSDVQHHSCFLELRWVPGRAAPTWHLPSCCRAGSQPGCSRPRSAGPTERGLSPDRSAAAGEHSQGDKEAPARQDLTPRCCKAIAHVPLVLQPSGPRRNRRGRGLVPWGPTEQQVWSPERTRLWWVSAEVSFKQRSLDARPRAPQCERMKKGGFPVRGECTCSGVPLASRNMGEIRYFSLLLMLFRKLLALMKRLYVSFK